jgi:DNA-directed RNA polymerase specialized sigma24 family protein
MDSAYAGAIRPKSVNRAVNEDAYTSDNPEDILIAKERWKIVDSVLRKHVTYRDYRDMVLDRFAGYSWAEISERAGISRSMAQHRTEAAIAYLRTQVEDMEF